ncbi:MAG: sulfurtransferase [Candidatus Poribacteria bacterium]|nr:MAG: sulfurtransferase [Candidatus Poribacteria bacterium]
MRRLLMGITAWLLGGVILSGATELPANKVVSTEWLQAHLEAPDLRIVDVRGDVIPYWEGHIPGAVYLNPETLRLPHRGVPVMLLDPELLAEKLGALGITPETNVVVYTETGDYKAPFLIWALDYIGHDRAAVLEGGFGKWVAEGRPVTQDYPTIEPTEYPEPKQVRDELRTTLEEMLHVYRDPEVAKLDVRATPLYTGERGFWKRNGHVPGFKGHFWGDDLNPDGTWKSVEELQQAYAALGVTPEKRIVVMCGQGLMSAHAYFTLRYILGYPNVENYDGGYHEWVAHDDLPVVTGSE